jgi:hypothetical protein
MIRSAAVVYVLEVSPEEVGDLLHDLVVVVCVGQQVEAHRGLLAVHELDMVAVLLEALGVRQLCNFFEKKYRTSVSKENIYFHCAFRF